MPAIRIHPAAADEADAAAAWYERERPGLGQRFQVALEAGLDLLEQGIISGVPATGDSSEHGVKRLVLRRFPYDIVCLPRGDEIIVLAFAHHSRRPRYWRNRTGR